jgi:hypothetical protein
MATNEKNKRVLWSSAPGPGNQQRHSESIANGMSLPHSGCGSESGETYDYNSVFRQFASKPSPKPFFLLVAKSLVVVQEFSLTCFLLARHRIALLEQDNNREVWNAPTAASFGSSSSSQYQQHLPSRLDRSNYALFAAMAVAIFYNSTALVLSRDDSKPTNKLQQQQSRPVKARQRTMDALLLAVLLRFLASVLRSLTASYSSDTVQRLALAGMVLHLVTCDYNYANGWGGGNGTFVSNAFLLSAITPSATTNKRPPFHGGTVALNAALFSVTLLVSRLDSNLSTYLFISLAVVLFAFYSVTRHAISTTHPPTTSGAYHDLCVCAGSPRNVLLTLT